MCSYYVEIRKERFKTKDDLTLTMGGKRRAVFAGMGSCYVEI